MRVAWGPATIQEKSTTRTLWSGRQRFGSV
jgi:hypothetical protein